MSRIQGENQRDLWALENGFYEKGYQLIAGTDEAGRGPLAGPVVAAAVILPRGLVIPGLNDSKKLSEAKREKLFPLICEQALTYAVAQASVEEIEQYNILHASQLAMRRAVESLSPTPDFLLIDGNYSDGFNLPEETVVGGDGLSANIAAASILAKVTRDRMMVELDKIYPQYGFARHKGYPTAAHDQALEQYGPCPIHRPSFLKKKRSR